MTSLRPILRRTLLGAGLGWVLFMLLGAYMNASIGAAALSNWGPLLLFSVIGLTVGGLVAPLVHRLLRAVRGDGGEAS